LAVPDIARGDSMPVIPTDLIRPVRSIVPSDIPAMSDEECLIALAHAVRQQDSEQLDEVARLIGRLAVTIE
jgi:predicted nucleotidyltransferase